MKIPLLLIALISVTHEGPPIPWRGLARITSTPVARAVLPLSATNNLVMTWSYTGPVTENHEIKIHHSSDLRRWSIEASIPANQVGAYQVPIRRFGFYRVSSVESAAPNNHQWHTISNLVMDP